MKRKWSCGILSLLLGLSLWGWRAYAVKGSEPISAAPITLTVPFIFEDQIPADFEQVAVAANELIQAKIGIQVKFYPILRPGSDDLRNAELTIQEKRGIHFDLVHASMENVCVIELNELLSQHGQGILQLLEETGMYGQDSTAIDWLPSVSDYVTCMGIAMRTDLLEKYDIQPSELHTFQDFDSVFAKIAPGEPELYMLSGYSTNRTFLGRLTYPLTGVFTVQENDPQTVANYYATEEYRALCKLFYQWNQKGFIDPFLAFQDINAAQLVEAGVLFSYVVHYKPGIEQETSNNCKMPMTVVPLMEPLVTNRSREGNRWGISVHCDHPEAAMKLLNLLYTDVELVNLCSYGIEGVHYQIRSDGSISWPEGVAKETAGYFNDACWILPNQYLSHTWDGEDPDIWSQLKEFNLSAKMDDTLGFSFDDTAVREENLAVKQIAATYTYGLSTGQLDPDIYLDVMLQEMEQAGLPLVQQEMQKQYDLWRGGPKQSS